MKTNRLTVAAVLAVSPIAASAASFDCAKASTLVENAICANPELSRRDEALASLYQAALKQDPAQVAQNLQMSSLSRCIAATAIMSAGLVQDPKVKADGSEIRNDSASL